MPWYSALEPTRSMQHPPIGTNQKRLAATPDWPMSPSEAAPKTSMRKPSPKKSSHSARTLNFKQTADLWIIFGCRGHMFLPHLLPLPIRSLDLQLGFAPSPLPGQVSRAVLSVAWFFQRTNRMDLRCETSKRWDVMPWSHVIFSPKSMILHDS